MMPPENNAGPAVEALNLTKIYRDFWRRPKVKAVDNIGFEIMPGEIFGLLGPNGSGKSSTLKMTLGLLNPTAGSISVLGASPTDVRTKERIGYMPEESFLYRHLTARETLDFFARLFDIGAAERKNRIDELLEMVGLTHASHRYVGEFSKGMARRIGLAQALINDPDLIILDEPTSGLDPMGCRQVKDLILKLAERGKTILLASHLLADVEDVCHRIAILYNGRIQAHGGIKQLLEKRNELTLTVGALPPEALKKVLAVIREQTGKEAAVGRPARELEQFFLDVVAEARRTSGIEASDGKAGQVAPFLSK